MIRTDRLMKKVAVRLNVGLAFRRPVEFDEVVDLRTIVWPRYSGLLIRLLKRNTDCFSLSGVGSGTNP
jgi:hypothetical protein